MQNRSINILDLSKNNLGDEAALFINQLILMNNQNRNDMIDIDSFNSFLIGLIELNLSSNKFSNAFID